MNETDIIQLPGPDGVVRPIPRVLLTPEQLAVAEQRIASYYSQNATPKALDILPTTPPRQTLSSMVPVEPLPPKQELESAPKPETSMNVAPVRQVARQASAEYEDIREAARIRKEAAVELGKAQMAVADEQAKALEYAQQKGAEIENKRLAIENERSAFMKKHMENYEEMKAKASESPGQVDTGRYWANKSGFQKVLSLLAVAAGGYAEGASGGRLQNTALLSINREIEQDVALQQQQIAGIADRRDKALLMQGNLIGMGMQRYGNDLAAHDATVAAHWNGVARQAEMLGAKTKNAEAKTAMANAVAAANEKEAEALNSLQRIGEESFFKKQQTAQGWARIQLEAEDRRNDLLKMQMSVEGKGGAASDYDVTPDTDPRSLPKEQRERFVPGEGIALDNESAKKARALKEANGQLMPILTEMKALRKKHGGGTSGITNPSAKARAEALSKAATFAIKRAEQAGALDKGLVEQMGGLIPEDPLEYGWKADARLDEAEKIFQSNYDNAMPSYMSTPRRKSESQAAKATGATRRQ